MTFEIASFGKPQETLAVFSGITILWEYLVFSHNTGVFSFCVNMFAVWIGTIPYSSITTFMKKSETSCWSKPSEQLRALKKLLVPHSLSIYIPPCLCLPGNVDSRGECTACIFSEHKELFHNFLKPKSAFTMWLWVASSQFGTKEA
jgi:hypothetical protein